MKWELIQTRKWQDINVKERSKIMVDRLAHPEMPEKDFAKKHKVELQVINRLQDIVWFDEDTASWAIIAKVMEKDLAILEKTADINSDFVDQVSKKRQISPKDVDVLDKMSNTILKRKMLIDKQKEDEKNWQTSSAPIVLTF